MKIIKYISIFISNSPNNNIENKFNFFNYICEKNYLNQLIINLNYTSGDKDDDYLSYYINFLKVINNRINSENIKLIFNEKYNIFPLLDQILLLLNNEDIMIRNSARNIFLSLIKLNYSPLIEYLSDIPRIAIFIILMRRIKSNILLMINLKNFDKNEFIEKTKEFKEKIVEDLLFMQDILSINIYKINYIIINCFFNIVILYLFIKISTFSNNIQNQNIKFEISKSINILRTIFKNIKNETIKNVLCFLIFSKKVYIKINDYLTNKNIEETKEYKSENAKLLNLIYFNFNYCYSKMKFEEFIICNYSTSFLKSFRYIIKHSGINEKEIYNEIKEISNLLQLKEEKEDIQICTKYLNSKLFNYNNNFFIRMYNFHHFISKKTGINQGIYQEKEKDSFLSILYTNFLYTQTNEIFENNNYFQNNILRKEILNYFEDEIKGNNGSSKNAIYNLILFFIEIIYDKNISKNIIDNIIKNNDKNVENKNNININKSQMSVSFSNNKSKSIIYPKELLEPINKEDFIFINNEKLNYDDLNLDNNYFSKIAFQNDNEQSDLIINLIDFIFYPRYELNNNDILLCFKLVESLFNESYLKNGNLINNMKSHYLKTLIEIKDILFINNNDLKNGIFKFSYSYFEKAFYLNKKSISDIINNYYSDLKLSSFVIIDNSPNIKEKTKLKNLFQKYISMHDLLNFNSFLFKKIKFPIKLIREELHFEVGEKVDIDKYNLTKINTLLYKANNDNKNNNNSIISNGENLTMFIYNNYLFFALSPGNVAKYDINEIDGEKNYLIKYMFCLRYINLIKDEGNNTLFFIFDENEYKFNIYIKLANPNIFNKTKDILVNGINSSILLEFSSISSFINNQITEYYKNIEKK